MSLHKDHLAPVLSAKYRPSEVLHCMTINSQGMRGALREQGTHFPCSSSGMSSETYVGVGVGRRRPVRADLELPNDRTVALRTNQQQGQAKSARIGASTGYGLAAHITATRQQALTQFCWLNWSPRVVNSSFPVSICTKRTGCSRIQLSPPDTHSTRQLSPVSEPPFSPNAEISWRPPSGACEPTR